MTIAFVLSGGGSLGAVQVGMLQALTERAVHPDLLIGTSAGAINAAYIAGRGTSPSALHDLATIWRGLRRQDIYPLDPLRHLLALAGHRPALCSGSNLRRLIETHLPYRNLEDASIALHIVTTDLLSGREVLLSTGNAVSAVLASATIPGVLPAVERDGLTLVDGGVANNAAISQAVALGADEVYVLPAGFACALQRPPTTALAAAVQALTLLIEQRLVIDVAQFDGDAQLKVLPPLCPLRVSSTDFSHAAELIERARSATADWLDSGGPALPAPERFLSLHHHGGSEQTSDDHSCSHRATKGTAA
ncbi:MAG: patatin-like phospholipase family protein [Acidimicrobiales bacterium]|nr:patatin-like phospholipase family protein [Acidimicrobiales bacterium]